MGWQHSIAGGQGNLIAVVFKSPDYVPGVSGWAVFKDGSVEFNNGTFRGIVTASTFEGTDFEVNSDGAFFYAAAPALGNLTASITRPNTAGIDARGNHWFGGLASYDQSSNSGIFLSQFQVGYLKNSGAGTAWTTTQGIFQALSPGFGIELAGSGFWSFGGTPVLGGITASDPADATGKTPETWHVVGSGGGAPAFGAGFAAPGAGDPTARFLLESDGIMVALDGVVQTSAATAANATMWTLPAAYRPAQRKRLLGPTSASGYTTAGQTLVQVTTAGLVTLVPATSAAGQVVVLDGMRFPVD
jgi:hypothetical protein